MKKKEKIALGVAGAALTLGLGYMLAKKTQVKKPKGAKVVTGFEVEKYGGKWFEIARMPYKHEKNLINVTADYSLNEDGSIKVVNSGYNKKKKKWETATGVAKLNGKPGKATLKVSFFGPFYSGYHVIGLKGDYKYALVAGNDLDYLWLLSRDTTMPDKIREEFLKKAESLGYKIEKLEWPEHREISEETEI